MPTVRYRLPVAAAIAVLMGLLCAPVAFAGQPPVASPYSLTTSPVTLSLTGRPGQVVTTEIRVRNNASTAQQLRVSASNFAASGEDGKAIIFDTKQTDPSLGWVHFSPQKFLAQPGEWTTIKVSFDLPLSAAFGYYYALRVTPQSIEASTGGSTVYAGSNAILALVDAVSPNAKRTLRITDFGSSRRIYEFLPVSLLTRLENTGNVHIAPAGNIFVTQGGKQVAVLDFNPNGGSILPQSKRAFTNVWGDGFPVSVPTTKDGSVLRDSNGHELTHLKWDFSQLSRLRFGKFTAKYVGAYRNNDGNTVQLDAAIDFWVIPWRLILAILFVVIFMVTGLYATLARAVLRVKKFRR